MARTVTVQRISPYVAKLERQRREIPIAKYLALLDAAASTGFLPLLDPNGRPTGNYDSVKAPDRIAIIQKLVDKGMPNRQEAAPLPEDVEAQGAIIDVSKLDDDELEKILAADLAKPLPIEAPNVSDPNLDPANPPHSCAVGHGPGQVRADEEEGEDGA